MKLPNAHRARIQRGKIADYLLNAAHPDNQGKAKFFAGCGFARDNWQTLATAFRRAARDGEVIERLETIHGVKYVVLAALETPSGRTPWVRTVWVVERRQTIPRLVTAYPAEREGRV